MICTSEQTARLLAVLQILKEEHDFREQQIIDAHLAEKNTEKYSNALKSLRKNYRYMVTRTEDFFNTS